MIYLGVQKAWIKIKVAQCKGSGKEGSMFLFYNLSLQTLYFVMFL